MRQYKGWMAIFVTIISVVYGIYSIMYFSGAYRALELNIMVVPHRAISLGFILVITYLLFPMTKSSHRDKLPWYDLLFIIGSVIPTAYIALFYMSHVMPHLSMGMCTTTEILLATTLMISVLEGTRRVLGWVLPCVAFVFVIHPLVGHFLPGILQTRHFTISRIASHVYTWPDGMFGMAMGAAATVIVSFIIFAAFMKETGIGRFFIDVALGSTGRFRGGPAKASIVASGFFGMLSGSGLANVATTGVFTIPLMKRSGYKPEFAAAVEAVASNGGQLVPPVMGIVAFIMAEILDTSYISICVAAALPAFLYYLSLFLQSHFEAAKNGVKGLPKGKVPSVLKSLKKDWTYVIPLIVLIGLLIVFKYSPEKSVWWALVSLIPMSLLRLKGQKKQERLTVSKTIRAFESAAKTMCLVGLACATAGLLIASVGLTGMAINLSYFVLAMSGGHLLPLLILAAVASFVLGMGLTSVPCYLMVAILIAPIVVKLGVAPIAAHLFAFWFGVLSFITPPVAICAYEAGAIANANLMLAGWQAARLGIVAYFVPFMFCYHPALLLQGSITELIMVVITSILGITALCAGMVGFLLKPLRWPERVLLILSGILMIWPGIITDLIAIAIFGGILAMQLIWKKTEKMSERDSIGLNK